MTGSDATGAGVAPEGAAGKPDREGAPSPATAGWVPALAAGAAVLAARLVVVAVAGNDVPFYDQWDSEGRWLYPGWRDGSVGWMDLFRPHNEHRILWTQLLNLALFTANGGQWDPLVQLAAGAALWALVAGAVTRFLVRELPAGRAWALAAAVAVAFLPLAGWHNALWGFQSQVGFALLFAVPALAWLPRPDRRWWGFAGAAAALAAMGAGGLVPVVALAGWGLRAAEGRRWPAGWQGEVALLGALLVAAVAARTPVPEHAAFAAKSAGAFLGAWLRLLAWPHTGQPLAALVLNLPLAVALGARLAGRRRAAPGESVVVAIGLWSAAVAAAAAWTRGGGDELAAGVPSRYVDFLVLLPLANLWCLLALVAEARARRAPEAGASPGPLRRQAAGLAAAWVVFVAVGWAGASLEMYRKILRPLARDREAPVRLARAFQESGDAAVFTGQPRLFVPHPDLAVVRAVLADPRLAGALPPSLQPDRPPGPLSRFVRALLGRGEPPSEPVK